GRTHQLVGLGVDAMFRGLRRHVAAFESHLEFPEPRLAFRQIERRGGRGADENECKGWQPLVHRNPLQRVSDEFTGRFCSALWANQRRRYPMGGMTVWACAPRNDADL